MNEDQKADPTAKPSRRPKKRVRKKKARKEKPTTQRCFFGLSFPLHEALQPLYTDLQEMAGEDSGLRLAPQANLHVTLKFLGTIKEAQLAEIDLLANSICQKSSALSLNCKGIGVFKNSIWVGIEANAELSRLAENLDLAAQGVGIGKEIKAYVPHVTVARFKASDRIKLSGLLEKYKDKAWGSITSKQVHLYLSETLQEGARYSILKSFELNQD